MVEANQKNNKILALVSVRRLGPSHKHELKDYSDEVRYKMKEFGNHLR